MRTKIKELKRIARGNLQGHFLNLIRVFVFCQLIVSLIEMPFSMMTNEVQFSTQNIIYYIFHMLYMSVYCHRPQKHTEKLTKCQNQPEFFSRYI